MLRLELIGRSPASRRWMDVVEEDVKEVGASVDDDEMETGDWLDGEDFPLFDCFIILTLLVEA